MHKKSEAKKSMERHLLYAMMDMGSESLCPETWEKLCESLAELSKTRHLGNVVGCWPGYHTVPVGDGEVCKRRGAATAAPSAHSNGPENEGCTCQVCGRKYRVDLLVSDELWERIKPAGKAEGAGLMCGICIMDAVERLGEFGVIYGDGTSDTAVCAADGWEEVETVHEQPFDPAYDWLVLWLSGNWHEPGVDVMVTGCRYRRRPKRTPEADHE